MDAFATVEETQINTHTQHINRHTHISTHDIFTLKKSSRDPPPWKPNVWVFFSNIPWRSLKGRLTLFTVSADIRKDV